MSPSRRYDIIVIGAGTAGLVAATRLAQSGASVCVLAKGIGSTHLAPGTIDVLGYLPAGSNNAGERAHYDRVPAPLAGVSEIAARQPEHPYAVIGADAVSHSVQWLKETAATGPFPGYTYVGGLEQNLLLPTAIGALKPSALAPTTIAAGDAGSLRQVCVAGLPALRDFHPKLCASNLQTAGIDAHGVSLDLPLERSDASSLGVAHRMDEQAWRREFCARLAPLVRGADQVGLPAMLGLRDPQAVASEVQERLGRPVFEIPTLPPSVPGMRLYEILRSALRGAGGQLVLGAEVIAHQRGGDRISSVRTASAGHDTTYEASWFVLASGGLHSGAITLDSRWQMHELVFGLGLTEVPATGQPRFVPAYFAEQPAARVGVAVKHDLRAREASNVAVVGACLPGATSWREGSGEGIALASGYRAAELIAAEMGAKTEALA